MAVLRDIPTRGWEYLYMEDTLEDDFCERLIETCDFCGTPLRYKHYIEHPEGMVIGVGCQCCDNLTSRYVATDNEAERKRDLSRIRTLINSTRWECKKNGSFITYRGKAIKIWENESNYCLQIMRNGYYGWYYIHRSYHDTKKKAVTAAYYFIKNKTNNDTERISKESHADLHGYL